MEKQYMAYLFDRDVIKKSSNESPREVKNSSTVSLEVFREIYYSHILLIASKYLLMITDMLTVACKFPYLII